MLATRVLVIQNLRDPWSFLRINLIAHNRHFFAIYIYIYILLTSVENLFALHLHYYKRDESFCTECSWSVPLEIFVHRFLLCSLCPRFYGSFGISALYHLHCFFYLSISLSFSLHLYLYHKEETGILGKYLNFPTKLPLEF